MRQLLPVYVALATLLERHKNLCNRHHAQPAMAAAVRWEIDRLVREYMPSGAGYDRGTKLNWDMCEKPGDPNACPHLLVFDTAFHHMNDGGVYVTWTEHQVICSPTFLGPILRVTGRDRQHHKLSIAETFHWAINQKVMADIHIIEVPDAQP